MLPQMPYRSSAQTIMSSEFGGLDRRDRIPDGSMEQDFNLSPDAYPVLKARKGRTYTEGTVLAPYLAIRDMGALVAVKGSTVYINNDAVEGVTLSTSDTMLPKQLVSMGAILVIWPDKVWINTQDPTRYGYLEQTNTLTSATVSFYPCAETGGQMTIKYVQDFEPTGTTSDPLADGDYWINTSTVPNGLYRYAASTGEWSGISATYIRIDATGIGAGLRVYDAVTISGITTTDQDVKDQLLALNAPGNIIYGCGDNYIIVAGILSKLVTGTQTMTVKRAVPDFDYICELDNRLWGCRYGITGTEVYNEIRASALGEPGVWDRFMGNSTDSYAVSVGSDGPFTAITSHLGYVLAWKEHTLHKLYGTQPSNFQLATIACDGVQRGSWQSVTDVGGVLYYKGRAHVLAYDGSMPQIVSEALGDIDVDGLLARYDMASGGALGAVLYLSMRRETAHGTYAWETLTLDTARGIWHTQPGFYGTSWTRHNDSLLCISGGHMADVTGQLGSVAEDPFQWCASFGPTGYSDVGRKYLQRYNVRCKIPPGGWLELWLRHDDGHWMRYSHTEGHGKTDTVLIPVRPRRCDHVRLRVIATAGVIIYSIARVYEAGGDGTGRVQ